MYKKEELNSKELETGIILEKFSNGKDIYYVIEENGETNDISSVLFWALHKTVSEKSKNKKLGMFLNLLGINILNTNELEIFSEKIMKKENFYDVYTEILNCYYNNGSEHIKIIYEGMKELVKFVSMETFEGFSRLEQFFLEKYCEMIVNSVSEKQSEKTYQENLVKNFNIFFPEYEFLGQYNKIEFIGNLDILAKEKSTGRTAIIELKTDSKNPNKQLFSYAVGYENPILIAVTTKEVTQKHPKIIYKVIPFEKSFIKN